VADGGLLVRPAPERLLASLRANALVLDLAAGLSLQGRTLTQLRERARSEAQSLAVEYTQAAVGVPAAPTNSPGPWIVTGHQPAIFHPGVWAKNLAVAALARVQEGLGLNLIVDNDLLNSTGIGVPRGPRSSPHVESFLMLDPQSQRPWEEAVIDNARPFETFGRRVSEAVEADWGYRPLVADTWTDAVAAREDSPRLADCLTVMRARQERRWGLANLELPLSKLEEGDSFQWFTAHILARLAEFQSVHNAALADYRRRNRVRSQSHPVPELRRRGDWREAPFWIWQVGETVRHPLYARPQGKRVELACDAKQIGKLRLSRDVDAAEAVEDLAYLSGEGWRIRSRALTTTLFARLCLADLFIHGIGGAKYDELTDSLIERFYGIRPPLFLTLTATQHLPLRPFPVSRDDALQLRRQLRDLEFNPDRVPGAHVSGDFAAKREQLVSELAAQRTAGLPRAERRGHLASARQLHLELQSLRHVQREQQEPTRQSLRAQMGAVESQLAANRILKSRDFAWCLYPEPLLHSLAQRIDAAIGAPA
jgi:hypothetical protein